MKAAFVHSDQLSRHVLHEGHPMKPIRLGCTYELLDAYGAFHDTSSRLVEPRPATVEELLTFHLPDYVQAVESLSQGRTTHDPANYNFSQGGDNPIFPGMYQAALLSAGASLVAAETVLRGEADVAFNPSGGLHHAMPGYASGFCIFNDPVLVIKSLTKRGLRVAYVDIDAHHGDGVQHAFYNTNQVLTLSIHESGVHLFPGTGFVDDWGEGEGIGYSVNLPLYPYTDDETYLWAFQEVVPPIVKAFKPDVLVTQLGVDSHFLDPLSHLALTTQGFAQAVAELKALSPGRWIALGGGGYDLQAVARAWTLAYGLMLDRDLPDQIPRSYQQSYHQATLRDHQPPTIEPSLLDDVRFYARKSVAAVKEHIFPHHGL